MVVKSVHARDGKTRLAVTDALNGDYEAVDPALRRALYAISTELDDHAVQMDQAHKEILATITSRLDAQDKAMLRIRSLLISTTATFVTAIGATLLNVMTR